ncbi:hypothetical protein CVT24_006521 [Panaeolus cyanescens]|uniref:Transcription activator GCR1-like domain-containing protein n=1 Tax=Panaeolus cyanescens TaxID=181874 RepID=A0A409WNF9_9AGAR|nr:hypothetical protein CVT24_006521 [Panaeolus cyanescens]
MKHEFPKQLTLLRASAGSPVDLQRIQNAELQPALTAQLDRQNLILEKIYERTGVLTPAKSFNIQRYNDRFQAATTSSMPPVAPFPTTPTRRRQQPSFQLQGPLTNDENGGIYEIQDDSGGTALRAFVNASPKSNRGDSDMGFSQIVDPEPTSARMRTQVDLVLPTAAAFSEPGGLQLFWPPVLGQQCITWNQVYPLIRQPCFLWESWRPSKTMNQYTLDEIWACWSIGEPVYDSVSEIQTGIKPPLREVERYFTTNLGMGQGWRSGLSEKDQKFWQRFREIPEYIDRCADTRNASPLDILQELKNAQESDSKLQGCAALGTYVKNLREKNTQENLKISTTEVAGDPDPSSSAQETKKRKKPITIRRPASRKKARPDN